MEKPALGGFWGLLGKLAYRSDIETVRCGATGTRCRRPAPCVSTPDAWRKI